MEALHRHCSPSADVTIAEICPVKPLGYWRWLLLSFIPGSRRPIHPTETNLAPYDLVILGLPKWTVSCPPINKYLDSLSNHHGKRIAVFVSYGGFGEKRFLRALITNLSNLGFNVVASAAFKRRRIEGGESDELAGKFWEEILSTLEGENQQASVAGG